MEAQLNTLVYIGIVPKESNRKLRLVCLQNDQPVEGTNCSINNVTAINIYQLMQEFFNKAGTTFFGLNKQEVKVVFGKRVSTNNNEIKDCDSPSPDEKSVIMAAYDSEFQKLHNQAIS